MHRVERHNQRAHTLTVRSSARLPQVAPETTPGPQMADDGS